MNRWMFLVGSVCMGMVIGEGFYFALWGQGWPQALLAACCLVLGPILWGFMAADWEQGL